MTNSPKKTRSVKSVILSLFRFFSFGIRTVLILMLVISILIARESNRCHTQAKLSQIVMLKDRQYSPRKFKWLDPNSKFADWTSRFFGVEWSRHLTSMTLYPYHSRGAPRVAPGILDTAVRLGHLEMLEIWNVDLSPDELTKIQSMDSLFSLKLINVDLTPEDRRELEISLPDAIIEFREYLHY